MSCQCLPTYLALLGRNLCRHWIDLHGGWNDDRITKDGSSPVEPVSKSRPSTDNADLSRLFFLMAIVHWIGTGLVSIDLATTGLAIPIDCGRADVLRRMAEPRSESRIEVNLNTHRDSRV